MRIKYFGNSYSGNVVGGVLALKFLNKVGRKRAWVEFKLSNGKTITRQVRIVHTQTEMTQAGFGCVLIPFELIPSELEVK